MPYPNPIPGGKNGAGGLPEVAICVGAEHEAIDWMQVCCPLLFRGLHGLIRAFRLI